MADSQVGGAAGFGTEISYNKEDEPNINYSPAVINALKEVTAFQFMKMINFQIDR